MVHIVTTVILLIAVMPGYVIIANGDNNTTIPVTYVSYIDDKIGFYKVLDTTTHKDSIYKERVLTINQGDTVIWLNDADTAILTVVSEQDLWDKERSKLGSLSRRFSYTFMMAGTYAVYVYGYDNVVHQTIIVNPVEGYPTPVPSPEYTPVPTPGLVTSPTPIPTLISTPDPTYLVPKDIEYPTVNTTQSKNYTVDRMGNNSVNNNSANNNPGKITDPDISWNVIIGFINAISNLIISLSVMIVAYKIWRDY